MMKIFEWFALDDSERQAILKRPALAKSAELSEKVAAIIQAVRDSGDKALVELTKKFDGVELPGLQVSREEFLEAERALPPEVLAALKIAYANIEKFHAAQLPQKIQMEVTSGVFVEKRFSAIDSVGLYVPGGTAVLPSTVLMLAIPAAIAGCRQRSLCTPPGKNGKVHPAILVAARLCGIERVYKVGGAQAIAALAYGTDSIEKVDKIFGPGNSFVTEAKAQVGRDAEGAPCDMPAGPSEVMVLSDGSAPAAFSAADLLSQAEHGADSQVVLVSSERKIIEEISRELEAQLGALPRAEIARAALAGSLFIQTRDMKESLEVANRYAPEHLILQIDNARSYLPMIRNAGSVFLGKWTPEAVGDYASGTNHVLPTYGYARAYSGLGTEAFMKSMTVQELSRAGIEGLGPTVETLAQCEGLLAHSNAVTVRLKEIKR